MRDMRALICGFLVLISFFIGYFLATLQHGKKYEDEIARIKYIEIKSSKTKISFGTREKNTVFLLDGKPIESQEIIYEKN